MLASDQSRMIEQGNFTFFPLGKELEKQMETIEDQEIKQDQASKVLKPEENIRKYNIIKYIM